MLGDILKLSLPLLLSHGIQTLMVLTDRFILAQKNPLYTSAATTGGFTAMCISLFFVSFIFFSTSLIARYFGKNSLRDCKIVFFQTLLVATAATPLLLLLITLGNPYFSLLGHPEPYKIVEVGYFSVMLIASIPLLFRSCIESFLISIGKSGGIFLASLTALCFNVLFTYLFVLGQNQHLFPYATGAAWGTALANVISLVVLLFVLRKHLWKETKKITYQEVVAHKEFIPFLRQGFFNGLEKFVNSFCFVCFVNMFVVYGDEVALAVSVVFTIDQIAFMPLMGIYGALVSIFSRFVGENRRELAIKALHSSLGFTLSLMVCFSLLFWNFSELLTSFFLQGCKDCIDKPLVYSYSALFLKATSIYILANSVIYLYKAALRSIGLSGFCFRISALMHGFLLLASYFAVYVFFLPSPLVFSFFVIMLLLLAASLASQFYREIRFKPAFIFNLTAPKP